MGEAKRRKLAGYVPEPRVKAKPRKKAVISPHGAEAFAMIAAMLANYPKIPRRF